jgi:hypothetical protein
MLYATCAPRGIGKLPIGAFTRTVAAALDEGDAGCEGDVVGEDPVRLAAGEGDVDGLAVVTPAVQLITAIAAHDNDREAPHRIGQRREQREGGLVGPLQVV